MPLTQLQEPITITITTTITDRQQLFFSMYNPAQREARLTTGYWLLATGYWLLATGYWLPVTGYLVRAAGYS